LQGRQAVFMRRVAARKAGSGSARRNAPADMPPADGALLQRLRAWRSEQARRQAVPAYVILHDATLAAIAAARPREVAQLSGIPGIGAKKLERYGEALVALVRD
jgi:ATP-dependent DNA helicase RecQ